MNLFLPAGAAFMSGRMPLLEAAGGSFVPAWAVLAGG